MKSLIKTPRTSTLSQTNDGQWPCSDVKCPETFPTKEAKAKHVQLVHEDEISFVFPNGI